MLKAKVLYFSDLGMTPGVGPCCVVQLEGADASWMGDVIGRQGGRIWRIRGALYEDPTKLVLDPYEESGGLEVGCEVFSYRGLESPMALNVEQDPIFEPTLSLGQTVLLPISFPSHTRCTVISIGEGTAVVREEDSEDEHSLTYGGKNWHMSEKPNS